MKKLFLLLVIVLLTACGTIYEVIDANKAKDLIDNGAILIDVRTEEEYANDHIEGSINIPLSNIESITYDLEDVIVLYCATGVRSGEAAKILTDKGYTKIYSLDGGLINWGFEGE